MNPAAEKLMPFVEHLIPIVEGFVADSNTSESRSRWYYLPKEMLSVLYSKVNDNGKATMLAMDTMDRLLMHGSDNILCIGAYSMLREFFLQRHPDKFLDWEPKIAGLHRLPESPEIPKSDFKGSKRYLRRRKDAVGKHHSLQQLICGMSREVASKYENPFVPDGFLDTIFTDFFKCLINSHWYDLPGTDEREMAKTFLDYYYSGPNDEELMRIDLQRIIQTNTSKPRIQRDKSPIRK
jgi:hypothetical protein